MSRVRSLSSSVFIVLACCIQTCQARDIFRSTLLYDWGYYGILPRVWYKSFHLASPLVNFLRWDEQCDDGYYLLSPRGSYVWDPAPVILDARGDLVWTDDRFGMVTDVKIQTYRGNEYITFWAGKNGALHGYGRGQYYMLDDAYQIFKILRPVGEGLAGDLHEFKITHEGTALMTIYNPVPADLTSVGGNTRGWLLDSMFQEIDIETNTLKFEWKASEHVPINYTTHLLPAPDDGLSPHYAFDFFHINSVDKDDSGNYVISSRHTNAIMCINPSGDIIWALGDGNMGLFSDLSDGRATNFRYQHHARLHQNNTLTIFDNAYSEDYRGGYSRGLVISLDTQEMTATLVQEYADTAHPQLSASQGSAQLFEDSGKMLLGYGFLPSFAELGPDGQVLCDARFAPWVVSHIGLVTSYRTFKSTRWVGNPSWPPSAFLKPSDGILYASWNGATRVDQWILQGCEWEDVPVQRYIDLVHQKKDGFEAAFEINSGMPSYLRVVAVDSDGQLLGHTDAVSRNVGNPPSTFIRDLIISITTCFVLVVVVLLYRRRVVWALGTCCVSGGLGLKFAAKRWDEWRRTRTTSKPFELQPLYQE